MQFMSAEEGLHVVATDTNLMSQVVARVGKEPTYHGLEFKIS